MVMSALFHQTLQHKQGHYSKAATEKQFQREWDSSETHLPRALLEFELNQ